MKRRIELSVLAAAKGGLRKNLTGTGIDGPDLPLGTVVVKVASRCNLACTYCYMYEMADETWRGQPRFIGDRTVRQLGRRLAEYAEERMVESLTVVAHGGEPLLAGVDRLENFFSTVDSALRSSGCVPRLGVQTNGTLIDDKFAALFHGYGVGVGVSLDGPVVAHDRHRVDRRGKGSSQAALRGIAILRGAPGAKRILGGILSYAHIDLPARDLLDLFGRLDVGNIDVLFPDFNHDTIPAGYRDGALGRWMIELFDLWIDRPGALEIRTFAVIMHLLLGGRFGYESFGANSLGVLVVESDGEYQASDTLKSSYEGVASTGLTIWRDQMARTEEFPLMHAASTKATFAAEECLRCPIFDVCGGGLLAHRYSVERGFDQPSVYCQDIKALVGHIRHRLIRELNDANLRRS